MSRAASHPLFPHLVALALFALVASLLGCGPDIVTGESEPIDFADNVIEQGVINCTESQDTGYSSGNSFPITVVTVDGKPAEVDTANAYYVMQQAAANDGVSIRIVSGFRTMSQQQYLYGCYVNCNCNNCNLAATPGYSNHQSGHALDLNTSEGGVLNWLNNNAASYGFSRTVPSENWHWEWWGGGPGGGPCGGAPECLADPGYGGCDGSVVTRCDENNQISTGDCGVFGAGCSTAGSAPHCVHPYCLTNLDGGETGTFCVDETKLGTCDLGVYSEGDCAAFGGTCSEAGGETHCVHYLCWTNLDGGEDGSFCLDDGTLGRCDLGAFEEVACGGPTSCAVVAGQARCATPEELTEPDDGTIDDGEPDDGAPDDGAPDDDTIGDDDVRLPPASAKGGVSPRQGPPTVTAYATTKKQAEASCAASGQTPLPALLLVLLFFARPARRRSPR